jgi:hypothetical protein
MSNPRNNNMSDSAKLPSLESWQRKERRDGRGVGDHHHHHHHHHLAEVEENDEEVVA